MTGGPTNPLDAIRCDLDDIRSHCNEAHEILRAVVTRMAQRARTIPEADDVVLLIRVRGLLYRIQDAASAHHPDRREP